MFDALKKKLRGGIRKLTAEVAEKEPEPSFEMEEQFTHEKETDPEEFLKEEPDLIEKEQEAEEHFEAEEPPEADQPELGKETLEEREPPEPAPSLEDKILEKEERLEKRGILKKIRGIPLKVREKELSPADIDKFFSEIEADLLYSNVALEVIDFFRSSLRKQLAERKIRRGQTESFLKQAFRQALLEIVSQEEIDLDKLRKPATLVFLGFNGSGKTTTIAKVAKYLKDRNKKAVLAAADTFRAAGLEQLEHHGKKLGLNTIRHKRGSDPAAVVFDARKHARARGLDFVLADTAGRSHADKNLMDELKKVVRVNRPDLKILVVDSLTGNDSVEQARLFDKAVGVDAVILTKLDVNKKGGSVLSVAYAIKKPILFLGTGQKYEDLIKFEPEKFVRDILP
jgi:fused signal recognition particle receptor